MKIIYLFALCFCSIISSNSRLLEKVTEQSLTTRTRSFNAKVRLARHIKDIDTFTINSREENPPNDEYFRHYQRKVEYLSKKKSITSESHNRKSRDSSERQNRVLKNITSATTRTVTQPKPKISLVKKPIPKYNEIDYDDDFQMKINRSPLNLIDSGEHEDEDFNLNDYDFDINHDEFIGRGRPLEPRVKQKDIQEIKEPRKVTLKPTVAPEIKVTKINITSSNQWPSNKKERSVEVPKKVDKDDYYDDTTSTKAPEKRQELDDEFNDDNEESKEYDGKSLIIRQIRSPGRINSFADKFEQRNSFKILGILPMFPEVPGKDKYFKYHVGHAHRKPVWYEKAIRG